MIISINQKDLFIQKINLTLFYLLHMFINLPYSKNRVNNSHSLAKQENHAIWWVVVIVAVISLIALMAACKLFGGSFAGDFNIIHLLKVSIKCKS